MSKKAKNIVVSALLTVIFLALNGLSAPAQEKSAIEKGDSLRRAYCFKAALDTLEAAKSAASDSLEIQRIEEAAMLARNGLNMLGFCNRPVVVAREKFARKDFFLYQLSSLKEQARYCTAPLILTASAICTKLSSQTLSGRLRSCLESI